MNSSAASPYSTGGGGTVLEHRYGATLLTHVLSGAPLYELGDTAAPLSVKFQAGSVSDTDDFLVRGVLADESEVCASIGVRRDPLIQRRNTDSRNLIGSFLRTLDQHFDAVVSGSWSLVLASVVSSTHAQEVAELVSIARDASTDNNNFRNEIHTQNRTRRAVKGRLEQLDAIVEDLQPQLELKRGPKDPKELTWLLLSCLRVRLLHLEGGDLSDRTHAIERLVPLTTNATASEAETAYTRLVELCGSFSPAATNATETHVREKLGSLLADDIWVGGTRRKVARELRVQRHRQLTIPALGARRRQSRLALGLSIDEVERSFLYEPELPEGLRDLKAGTLLALVAPIGSGKSDLAARWLLAQVESTSESYNAPVPFWVRADELTDSLELHIEKSLGTPEAPEQFGVDVVLDGLDESPEAPATLEIQTFLAKYPKSRVVLTARPGENLGEHIPVCRIPEWTSDQAKNLIASVMGEPCDVDRLWTDALRQSVRRPLFALLAAHHFRHGAIGSPAELLVAAVSAALSGFGGDPGLEELAIALTRTGRAVDPRLLKGVDIVSLRSTRLVEFSGLRVRFALPIFEQWFAAQAVLSGKVPASEFTSDLRGFARWRYVLAVAISSGTHETISPVLGELARWNPGAAAWILLEGKSSGLDADPMPLVEEPKALGEEIIHAAEAWLQGLGPVGSALYPLALSSGVNAASLDDVQLMVSWDGDQGWVAWRPCTDPGAPRVMDSSSLSMGKSRPSVAHSIRDPIGESWVWDYTLSLLTHGDRLASVLQSRNTLVALTREESVVRREDFAWCVAVALEVSEFYPFRLTQAMLDQASSRARLEAADRSQTWVSRNGLSIPLSFYARLELELDDKGEELLNDIWPDRDLANPDEGTMGYSEGGIIRRARTVYEAAAQAYEEIRESLLPSFGRILGHAATFPAVMEGEIQHEHDGIGGDFGLTSIDYWFRTIRNEAETDAPPLVFNLLAVSEKSKSWEDLSEVWDALGARRKQDPTGSVFEISTYMGRTLEPTFFGRRPATHIAIQWLLHDLHELGWVERIPPVLHLK